MMHWLYFFCLISVTIVASENANNSSTEGKFVSECDEFFSRVLIEEMADMKNFFCKLDENFVAVAKRIASFPEPQKGKFHKQYLELIALIQPFQRALSDSTLNDAEKMLICLTGLRGEPRPIMQVINGLRELRGSVNSSSK